MISNIANNLPKNLDEDHSRAVDPHLTHRPWTTSRDVMHLSNFKHQGEPLWRHYDKMATAVAVDLYNSIWIVALSFTCCKCEINTIVQLWKGKWICCNYIRYVRVLCLECATEICSYFSHVTTSTIFRKQNLFWEMLHLLILLFQLHKYIHSVIGLSS